MPKQEAPLHQLKNYLPDGSFDEVCHYLMYYKVQLTITRERKSVLGDYRNSYQNKNHRISVNGNLNPYSFLITLLHELAHLFTFERYGHRVLAHGQEWKNEFSKVLAQFLAKHIFPADIQRTLLKTLQNPAASSCADTALLRVLHQYDKKKDGITLIETLPEGAQFTIKGGRIFIKEERIRKRFKCKELATGKIYLFSPVYEVQAIDLK
ncbi:SprT-like domain-containing protein [Ferruginibacter sp.]|uniref:SprT-like domain-containing protein n=1 Tax=Ferruginibacter sp. TaxID=1940288 RepID=UPI00198F24F1|nr:SprT-like domain-containing protein [Ferruginibacter sp.]MBC7628328.1 SprT-like domain-containing protein [Ferruginibacter sp.]